MHIDNNEALANLWAVFYEFPNFREEITSWAIYHLAEGKDFIAELDNISEPFSRSEAIVNLKSISSSADPKIAVKFLYNYLIKNYNFSDCNLDCRITLLNLIRLSKFSDVDHGITKFPPRFLEIIKNTKMDIDREDPSVDPMTSRESCEKIIQMFEIYFSTIHIDVYE